MTTSASDLAHELGAIASGEEWVHGDGALVGADSEWVRARAADVPKAAESAPASVGYVLPSAVEWHAATVRLIEAYRASLADPETGLCGAHECMREMARMAGMEVL